MKRSILASFALLFAFGVAASAQEPDPGTVDANNVLTSKAGRFSVSLPAGSPAPKVSANVQKTDSGDMTIVQYSADGKTGTWIVGYYDVPPKVLEKKTVEQALEDGRDGSVKATNGKLIRDAAITVEGNPGRSIYIELSGENTIYARSDFVFVKGRMYNYLYLSTVESELSTPYVKKFFDSFHITH
jgi:hypothetical protein